MNGVNGVNGGKFLVEDMEVGGIYVYVVVYIGYKVETQEGKKDVKCVTGGALRSEMRLPTVV